MATFSLLLPSPTARTQSRLTGWSYGTSASNSIDGGGLVQLIGFAGLGQARWFSCREDCVRLPVLGGVSDEARTRGARIHVHLTQPSRPLGSGGGLHRDRRWPVLRLGPAVRSPSPTRTFSGRGRGVQAG